jgi:hypothetical protein
MKDGDMLALVQALHLMPQLQSLNLTCAALGATAIARPACSV